MTTPAVPPEKPNDGPERETLPPPVSFDKLVSGGDNTVVADAADQAYPSGMSTVAAIRAMKDRQPPADFRRMTRARVRARLAEGLAAANSAPAVGQPTNG